MSRSSCKLFWSFLNAVCTCLLALDKAGLGAEQKGVQSLKKKLNNNNLKELDFINIK